MAIYRSKEFRAVMQECFEYADPYTNKILLALDENDQSLVTAKLAEKLYANVIDRIDDVNFGEIPATKGNIKLLPYYGRLIESIELIRSLLVEFKQDTSSIDIISNALHNIESRTSSWELAYKLEVDFLAVIYETITLAIISATGYLITACVDFIKVPNADNFNATVDKVGLAKTKESLLLRNLNKFNECCDKGDMDKTIQYLTKNGGKNFVGGIDTFAVISIVVLAALALMIIPMIRELIYFFYYCRVRLSDYFDLQANLLQGNANNVKTSSKLSKDEIKKVVEKQEAIVKVYRTMSNSLAVKLSDSEKKAQKDILDANKSKKKIDDVIDNQLPDSAASSLF